MNKTAKPNYVCVLTAVFMAGGVFAAGDSLDNMGNVRLKGYLGERLDAMIANHVAAQDVDYITAPFMEKTERRGWWQTEFWGKWNAGGGGRRNSGASGCIRPFRICGTWRTASAKEGKVSMPA